MSEQPPRPDWSDDRLDAAFAARSAKASSAPTEIAERVRDRIGPQTGVAPAHRWPRFAVAGIAAALVIVVGGAAVIGNLRFGPTNPSATGPAPTGVESTDGAATTAPTPDELAALTAALGAPVTVSDAIAVRDANHPSREIVVEGYLWTASDVICPASLILPVNPTVPNDCLPTWLIEQPDQVDRSAQPSAVPRLPGGPAFQPSFALVTQPRVTGLPLAVKLVGHFHDRRAVLCGADIRQTCEQTFIVDRVSEIGGKAQPLETLRRPHGTLADIEEDVDGLVRAEVPGSIVLSRQVMELRTLFGLEPILKDDQVLSVWDPMDEIWLETVVDLGGDVPTARTFALIDGSDWFAEVTASGARMLDRTAAAPTQGPQGPLPTGDPSAFDGAPSDVLGIPVTDIASLQRVRSASMDEGGRDERAIRAWYLAPQPGVACAAELPAIHAPTPPCDEARHWLLDDPAQLGVEPGQLRSNPAIDHYPPVINPLLPIDVPFDVGPTWQDGRPIPRPVIVLGHFIDNRVDTYAGNLYFVLDALAWTPGQSVGSLDRAVRLTEAGGENVEAVLSRIQRDAPNGPVATWVSVVDAASFMAIDRRAESLAELNAGAPVWAVARLVPSERDGRQRLAVEWAWTADGGDRVWSTACADCGPDLATNFELRNLDENTPILRVFDYADKLTSASSAAGRSRLQWQPVEPVDFLDVARGDSDREVVVRWRAATCLTTWRFEVHWDADDSIVLRPSTGGEGCEGDAAYEGPTVIRRVVLLFDQPVEPESFRTIDVGSGG